MDAPLDRATLLARFDGLRRFARGGRRAPHKPLLLLYALARLEHDRQAEVRFNAAEAALRPLIRTHGPWGTEPRLSYPYGRLVNDHLRHLPGQEVLVDPKGDVREAVARERDAAAGFAPEVLAAFAHAPELIDAVALRLLDRHFAPGLHKEILAAVGLRLGPAAATERRRDVAFRAAVPEAYLAECRVCGLSLRPAEGLVGVDAAHSILSPFRALHRSGESLDGLLANQWADKDAPVLVAVHLAMPGATYTDRSKTALAVPHDVGEGIAGAVTGATAKWAKHCAAVHRDRQARLRRHEAMTAAAKPKRIKTKAAGVYDLDVPARPGSVLIWRPTSRESAGLRGKLGQHPRPNTVDLRCFDRWNPHAHGLRGEGRPWPDHRPVYRAARGSATTSPWGS